MKIGIRFIRTTQEKRANQDGIWNRSKRSTNRLPDVREDIWICPERCWKNFRKTQYKGI